MISKQNQQPAELQPSLSNHQVDQHDSSPIPEVQPAETRQEEGTRYRLFLILSLTVLLALIIAAILLLSPAMEATSGV